MKTKELEKMLDEQILFRLNKLEDDQDATPAYALSDAEYKRLRSEIEQLEKMRSEIHSDRLDRIQRYIELGVRTGVPSLVTIALSLLGYGLEGLFGNACSRTLQGIVSKSPKMQ